MKVIVIGSGYGGMSAAARLAHAGYAVTVFEKNEQPGGRASVLHKDGFTFDLGPSWYMMPELLDELFESCDASRDAYYTTKQLDPSYRVFFDQDNSVVDISADTEKSIALFESWEEGAGEEFKQYLADVQDMYESGVGTFIDRPFLRMGDLFDPAIIGLVRKSGILKSFADVVRKRFSSQKIHQILEFPTIFLGGVPETIPGVFTLISYADFGKKIWYPDGGFGSVSKGIEKLCLDLGVQFRYESPIDEIIVKNDKAIGVIVDGVEHYADIVVANGDYHFVETQLLSKQHQTYPESFWDDKKMSPSVLLFYAGVNTEGLALEHHNFFFNEGYDNHLSSLYDSKADTSWMDTPQFYVNYPSKTDDSLAPEGSSVLFFLLPIPPGKEFTEEEEDRLVQYMLDKASEKTGVAIRDHIATTHCINVEAMRQRYNAYKGNAFGLGHTLKQSFVFRPKNVSKKVSNLYYTGQYTNPGTGTALAVVSGKIVYDLITQDT